MAGIEPGGGLSSGTSIEGWIRTDEQGAFVPCGCGQAVQRPDPDAVAADVENASRVFVCESDECDRRTVERAAASGTEADR
jgi:hypothetical protein